MTLASGKRVQSNDRSACNNHDSQSLNAAMSHVGGEQTFCTHSSLRANSSCTFVAPLATRLLLLRQFQHQRPAATPARHGGGSSLRRRQGPLGSTYPSHTSSTVYFAQLNYGRADAAACSSLRPIHSEVYQESGHLVG